MKKLKTPNLIINYKNYLEASGEKAVQLSSVAESIAEELSVEIAVAPPLPFLSLVSKSVKIPVLSQHSDAEAPGSTTGSIVPEVLKEAGASGSLVNHSERRLKPQMIEKVVKRLREVGLTSVVCARTPREVSKYTSFIPDFIAIEPPELIGTGIAVSKARPSVVTNSVRAALNANPDVKVICGAGIVSGEDVASAIKLGALGVLVASGIVKADDWKAKIRELAAPLTKV